MHDHCKRNCILIYCFIINYYFNYYFHARERGSDKHFLNCQRLNCIQYLSILCASDDQAFRHRGQNNASLCLLHSAAPIYNSKINNAIITLSKNLKMKFCLLKNLRLYWHITNLPGNASYKGGHN